MICSERPSVGVLFQAVRSSSNNGAVLSKSFEMDEPLEPVLAIRKIRHERAENQLFLAHKNASLKSGARGFQARKDFKAAEAQLEASSAMYVHITTLDGCILSFRLEQPKEDIETEAIKTDTQDAMEMLNDLQSQLEAVGVPPKELNQG